MTRKDFLPSSKFVPFDIENGLLNNATIPPVRVRVPSKCGTFVRKMFPVFGICTLIFGTIMIGSSYVTVEEGQVGFYGSAPDVVYSTGLFIQFPWIKEKFLIATIGNRSIMLWNIRGISYDNYDYDIKCIAVEFEVSDVPAYISKIVKNKSESNVIAQLTSDLNIIVRERLDETPASTIRSSLDVIGIEVDHSYGISIKSATYEDVSISTHQYNVNPVQPTTTTEPTTEPEIPQALYGLPPIVKYPATGSFLGHQLNDEDFISKIRTKRV